MELQEQDLQLVVSNKSLGSLTTNALNIKAAVEAALPNYDISNYNEDNIDVAKKDKAMLNTASKSLNSKRIELEKEFMRPFEEFKAIVGDTCKLISECSGKIDIVVKQSEQIAKDLKRKKVDELWEATGFKLVPLLKVFDDKWLLKGTKEKDIVSDMREIVATINDDVVTIKAIGEDEELLTSIYLESLNLNSTIQYARKLKENKERVRAEAKPDPAPPLAPEVAIEAPAEQQAETTTVPQDSEPDCIVRAFKVTATKQQIIAIAEFMDARHIRYEKVEVI